MKLVEQHIIKRTDPRFTRLDEAAFASKNLWNAANYLVRQSFLFAGKYLNYVAVFHQIKSHEAYQALPRKVSNQVLLQLHNAWASFFEAMDEWREHPEQFTGRPKLPGYKKTAGRNLLVYEWGAIWKRELDQGVIAVSDLVKLVCTAQSRESIQQVRIVPKGDHYVIEVVYQDEPKPAPVDPGLFLAADLGVDVLAALTSNKPGFIPRLVNGRPVKSLNQFYNKQRARHQKRLARANRSTSRQLDRITTKRNRRILHYLHTASRRIIELLVAEGIGTLIIGKNPLWKQVVEMGKRNKQAFVHIPHACLIEMLSYKAELVGIRVVLTEESYASQASFLARGMRYSMLLGGLVNSAAMAVLLGQIVRGDAQTASDAPANLLLADLAMVLRNGALVVLFALPGGLRASLPTIVVLAPMLLAGAALVTVLLLRARKSGQEGPQPEGGQGSQKRLLRSPLELRSVLVFGALFLTLTVVSGLAERLFGAIGFLAVIVVGLLLNIAILWTVTRRAGLSVRLLLYTGPLVLAGLVTAALVAVFWP